MAKNKWGLREFELMVKARDGSKENEELSLRL